MRSAFAFILAISVCCGVQKYEYGIFENFVLTKAIFQAELKFHDDLRRLRSALQSKRDFIAGLTKRGSLDQVIDLRLHRTRTKKKLLIIMQVCTTLKIVVAVAAVAVRFSIKLYSYM